MIRCDKIVYELLMSMRFLYRKMTNYKLSKCVQAISAIKKTKHEIKSSQGALLSSQHGYVN